MSAPAAIPASDAHGRYLAVDEQGHALRATWRPAHGFVNLSLWRDDRCVETFHLTPTDASDLIAFLVAGFAASVPAPTRPHLEVVAAAVEVDGASRWSPTRLLRRLRR
jgi:hypothetical protein